MLWAIEIRPKPGWPDTRSKHVAQEARDMHLANDLVLTSAHGYLLNTDAAADVLQQAAGGLLVDAVAEEASVVQIPAAVADSPRESQYERLAYVFPKPGVTDPVAETAQAALAAWGVPTRHVSTYRKYELRQGEGKAWEEVCKRLLYNDAIERMWRGPLALSQLEIGSSYVYQRIEIPIRDLDLAELQELSRAHTLSLSRAELLTIQGFYRELGRDPTDIELETIAQTWSEHCSHKTLGGKIRFHDERGTKHYENMLKETIFAATRQIRTELGEADWCISVFKDNAGVIAFDETDHIAFKVETHNHPSAIEPYGGSNTGLGGVIRDILGTGLGAKPICNTDVFCFAPIDTAPESLPDGVIHPRRVMRKVVEGVRDYGNRMGIPTVNGAIYFDERYLGNPLVFCGCIGLIPAHRVHKSPRENDWIVSVGGRTGRDGIHGATFSSVELTSDSEDVSGGAVQIGNAITEKMVLDVLLKARDENLYHAVTDCGAGGFSSAVGEMGAELGAEVWLEKAPLKYSGLSYTEIWISEAQERMVLAVPPSAWERFKELCESEGVEATVLGRFGNQGKLKLTYNGHVVGDLPMAFLHDGRPQVVREAQYVGRKSPRNRQASLACSWDYADLLHRILASPNVASKEWVVRQYDHEVQGGCVVKPFVGCENDGPSDAAVMCPKGATTRGVVVACGMQPRLGDYDTYWMAAGAIDEAVRNCVAVGANPERIALLDNFCWGNTDRPETLGSLVRAAEACHEVAIAWRTPFISGKDSLYNEFSFTDRQGQRQSIAIPPSLLISAIGLIEDARLCVTMDLKRAGNLLFQVGATCGELAGSQLEQLFPRQGFGGIPRVEFSRARQTFQRLHQAICHKHVISCHDLSEGGLAVALAEMAFAGGLGAEITLAGVPSGVEGDELSDLELLFAETPSRFLCEVPAENREAFLASMAGVPCAKIGHVSAESEIVLVGRDAQKVVLRAGLASLKKAWKSLLEAW